jgi:hypothetical protein
LNALPFYHGEYLEQGAPLERYLPQIPRGLAADWLLRNFPAAGAAAPWILDPFGASPCLPVEMARAGYRVLVTVNNPILRFLIELAADPPTLVDRRAALADLATASKGNERIEPHLRELYRSECARCGQAVMVEAFVWERGAAGPQAKLYTCAHCGAEGEHPVTETDLTRSAAFASPGPHRARALERVASLSDPDRQHAEDALEAYLPRAVYALFTLINKLEGLLLSPARRRALWMLLLLACDQGNTLWAYPAERERPLQLTTPTRFRENNIWLALEAGAAQGYPDSPRVSVTRWPDLPPETGGICIWEGRLKELKDILPSVSVGAVFTALPRPNQAFWTLSALWSGWLWGREAVGPFISVLRRRRYDWAWHTNALSSAFDHLRTVISSETPVYALFGPMEVGFLAAALVAGDDAGYQLQGLALQNSRQHAQILWKGNIQGHPSEAGEGRIARLERLGLDSSSAYLEQRAEPADHLHMTAAALAGVAGANYFGRSDAPAGFGARPASREPVTQELPSQHFSQLQGALRDVLTYRGGFLRFGAGEAVESGLWWLRRFESDIPPLADRVEIAIVNYLVQHDESTFEALEGHLYTAFPGLLTPERDLIRICLESYAAEMPPRSGRWRLRPEDAPLTRRSELETVAGQLRRLAARLGFQAVELSPMRWVDTQGNTRYRCYTKASAVLSPLLLQCEAPLDQVLIVIPGGRAQLAGYKLNNDPRLMLAVKGGCRLIKYRHLRWLLETPLLTPDQFMAQLDVDPLTLSDSQMRLL